MEEGKPVFDSESIIYTEAAQRKIAFMFPGQGSQYKNVGRELYRNSEIYRSAMDEINEKFKKELGCDYIRLIFDGEDNADDDMQPYIFMCEYALALYLDSIGICPDVVVGHSVGEYTAACLSGIFTVEDTIHIISERCRLMRKISAGSMAAVMAKPDDSRINLDNVSIAAINSENAFVISGEKERIEEVERTCKAERISFQYVKSHRAYHSYMLDGICDEFRSIMNAIKIHLPEIPIVSCITGEYMNEEFSNPEYWVSHLRNTVMFDKCLTAISGQDEYVYVEVGPGTTLSAFAKRKENIDKAFVFSAMSEQMEREGKNAYIRLAAKLWESGAEVDAGKWMERDGGHKISLPLYAFEKNRYFSMRENKEGKQYEKAEKKNYARPKLDTGFVPPETIGEKVVTAVFEEKIGVDGIGMTDDFFALGGDSLIAGQIISEINMIFQISIGLADLLTQPTIKATVEVIEKALGSREVFEEIAEIYNSL